MSAQPPTGSSDSTSELYGFQGTTSPASSAQPVEQAYSSLMAMLIDEFSQIIVDELKDLVSLTGQMGDMSNIIQQFDQLMVMLNQLDQPGDLPSNYGVELQAQIGKCKVAIEQLPNTPQEMAELKNSLLSQLSEIEEIFTMSPFEDAFENLASDLNNLLSVMDTIANTSPSVFTTEKDTVANELTEDYADLYTDLTNLNQLCSLLNDQFGYVPTAIQTLDTELKNCYATIGSISVSGKGEHGGNYSLSEALAGDYNNWQYFWMSASDFVNDLNKALNGVSGYSCAGWSNAESVINTTLDDITAAEGVTLPPNEQIALMHEALTTPISENSIYQQEMESLITTYNTAVTDCTKSISMASQTGSSDMIIAMVTILQAIKFLLNFIMQESSKGYQVNIQVLQQIKKIL